jgi:hypothetical protein
MNAQHSLESNILVKENLYVSNKSSCDTFKYRSLCKELRIVVFINELQVKPSLQCEVPSQLIMPLSPSSSTKSGLQQGPPRRNPAADSFIANPCAGGVVLQWSGPQHPYIFSTVTLPLN